MNKDKLLMSTKEIDFFVRNGFIKLNSISTKEEVCFIRTVLTRLLDNKAGFYEGHLYELVKNEDTSKTIENPQLMSPYNHARELVVTQFRANGLLIAKQLLGPKARFVTDHAILKRAHIGAATPWHQDEAFRDPNFTCNEISIWMPLQNVNLDNGCMQFIPGSHKNGVLPHQSPNNDNSLHFLECKTGFNEEDAIACPIPIGGCTIHTGFTLHYAGPNQSSTDRFAYILIFATPLTLATPPRRFEWLKTKKNPSAQRQMSWRKGRGKFIVVYRRIRNGDVFSIDYLKLQYAKLKLRLLHRRSREIDD